VSVVGSPATVREGLEKVVEQTGADEIIATAQIHDFAAQVRSLEILSRITAPVRA